MTVEFLLTTPFYLFLLNSPCNLIGFFFSSLMIWQTTQDNQKESSKKKKKKERKFFPRTLQTPISLCPLSITPRIRGVWKTILPIYPSFLHKKWSKWLPLLYSNLSGLLLLKCSPNFFFPGQKNYGINSGKIHSSMRYNFFTENVAELFCLLPVMIIKVLSCCLFSSCFVFQFSSVTQPCLTLCNPMNPSTPGLPVHHQLWEFTQTPVH